MQQKTFRITGRIVDRRTQNPILGLKVEVWADGVDRSLRSGMTDGRGTLAMEFTEVELRELFLDRAPEFFFKIYRHDELITSTEDSVIWNGETASREIVIEVQIPERKERTDERRLAREENSVSVSHEFLGRLLSQDTSSPIQGFTVSTFDLDADEEPREIGYDITNEFGLFTLSYTTLPTEKPSRRLRLHVRDTNSKEIESTPTEFLVEPDKKEILEIRIRIPQVPDASDITIGDLARKVKLDIPAKLLETLEENELRTLSDVWRAGGISNLKEPLSAAEDKALRTLESFADLSVLSTDDQVKKRLIDKGLGSPGSIANATRSDFVDVAKDATSDFKTVATHFAARAQSYFLNNIIMDIRAKVASNFGSIDYKEDFPWGPPISCECKDCQSALSPLAYLADLLDYALIHLKDNDVLITLQFLTSNFHQPFGALPASCESMDKKVRQVRICIEVLRSYLAMKGIPAAGSAQRASLDKAEYDYRLAAYMTLLSKIGTSYEDIRLARNVEPEKRTALADRLGIDLMDPRPATGDELDQLFLNPAAQAPDGISEQTLERLFGLVDTTRNPLSNDPIPEFQKWRLHHLRTIWNTQDWPVDVLSDGRPLIDPDIIGPDDFRIPTPKANVGDPDKAFDIWKRRRQWVDGRLAVFSALKKTDVNGKQVPDFGSMFTSMYERFNYGAVNIVATWNDTTEQPKDLVLLYNTLTYEIDDSKIKEAKDRILKDLNLNVESFKRLMEIYTKDRNYEKDQRNEKVKDEEWKEVYSVLTQTQKARLFSNWVSEEQIAGVLFGPKDFWISIKEPIDGDWPPEPVPLRPRIDPDAQKLSDLPEATAGKQAIAEWQTRKTALSQIYAALKEKRETNADGLDVILKWALGHPNPGDDLPHVDLDLLKKNLNDPNEAEGAKKKIIDDLFLTIDGFNRLMTIKGKDDDGDPLKKPTTAEWEEVYALLTLAQKQKREFPNWIRDEKGFGMDEEYWRALKAKLPKWRANAETRQEWLRVLRIRCQPPVIDSDLIGPGDFQNPAAGDSAFDLWAGRRAWIDSTINDLKTARVNATNAPGGTPLAGIETIITNTIGVSAADLTALADERKHGDSIEARLDQLTLSVDAFSYLLRIHKLTSQAPSTPILDFEWNEIYSILAQVEKKTKLYRLERRGEECETDSGGRRFQVSRN